MVLKPSSVKHRIEGVGTLYPTVAASDGWVVVTHLYAASKCYGAMLYPASLALTWIAMTAGLGCLRFGINETLFKLPHSVCSDVAGFSAIPMLGFQFYGLDDEVCMLPLAFFPLSRLIRGQKGAEVTPVAARCSLHRLLLMRCPAPIPARC